MELLPLNFNISFFDRLKQLKLIVCKLEFIKEVQ